MIKMKRSGVILSAYESEVSGYERAGFKRVEEEAAQEPGSTEEAGKTKTFSRLKVDELKVIAEALGIELEGKNGKELAAEIKETTDEDAVQTLIDTLITE